MQPSVQAAYWSVLTPTAATNVNRGFVGGGGNSNNFWVGQYANSSEDMIGFYTGTSLNEQMRIMDSGKVGVGTSAPAYRLDVNGTIHSSAVSSFSMERHRLRLSIQMVRP